GGYRETCGRPRVVTVRRHAPYVRAARQVQGAVLAQLCRGTDGPGSWHLVRFCVVKRDALWQARLQEAVFVRNGCDGSWFGSGAVVRRLAAIGGMVGAPVDLAGPPL